MKSTNSSIINEFSRLHVLVIGEAILESFIRGSAQRLSLEAPAPVIGVQSEQDQPGGAANAAMNARALGAEVTFLSVIGKDQAGETLLKRMREAGIGVERVLRRPDRHTLLRRKIYADTRLLVRYDEGSHEPISSQNADLLIEQLRQLWGKVDVVLLSDYGGSILTSHLVEQIAALQKEHHCLLVADTRRLLDFQSLRLAALRLSANSALAVLDGSEDVQHSAPADLLAITGEKIMAVLQTNLAVITLDDDGVLVFEHGKANEPAAQREYARGLPINRVDGAGDAFSSGLALGLAAGAPVPIAVEIASAAAALVVKNDGQPTCCQEEVKAYLSGGNKLVDSRAALAERIGYLRQQKKRIVFTNGCFDILHSAHVGYLNQAKAFGDVLVIGVNTDESVRRLKGPERPINNLAERCKVLAGLSCVDFVIPFDEENPIKLIEIVKPDVFVKGGDYTRETLPEVSVVEGLGGKVQLLPYVDNHSTSGVIERIRQIYAPPLNLEKIANKLPEGKLVAESRLNGRKVRPGKPAPPVK